MLLNYLFNIENNKYNIYKLNSIFDLINIKNIIISEINKCCFKRVINIILIKFELFNISIKYRLIAIKILNLIYIKEKNYIFNTR